MDQEFLHNRVHLGVIAAFLIGLFILALGGGLFLFKNKGNSASEDIQILSPSQTLLTSPTNLTQILVDVDGAVVSPGLYHLNSDSRVDDAVKAAGGMRADADRNKINLAAKVVDGQKVHVATVGESAPANSASVMGAQTSMISINSGTEAELESLPGVGPVTGQKIVANRPYSSLEDLKTKKAVTSATYEKIKELITL
ncbi:MAG TPA: ComEA family DNA-binding protein [Candidatus Saccharimonadales bacterium]|nr:ComEA family DNA-binding protein [Candidatus Saccharimonadales bacterium]